MLESAGLPPKDARIDTPVHFDLSTHLTLLCANVPHV